MPALRELPAEFTGFFIGRRAFLGLSTTKYSYFHNTLILKNKNGSPESGSRWGRIESNLSRLGRFMDSRELVSGQIHCGDYTLNAKNLQFLCIGLLIFYCCIIYG